MSGRRDIIVVSSVSCLYGIGNPDSFHENIIQINTGENIGRNYFLRKLVDGLYSRSDIELKRGTFRVRGDTIDVFLAYDDIAVRFVFWGDTIEEIVTINPVDGKTIKRLNQAIIFPANIFVTSKE